MTPYTLSLVIGIIASALLPGLVPGEKQPGEPDSARYSVLDTWMICILAGLAGARLFFTFLHWPYYSMYPETILRFWKGGLDWAGAIAGGLAAVYFRSRAADTPFRPLLDLLCIPALIISFSHRIGFILDGTLPGAGKGLFSFLSTPAHPLAGSAQLWSSQLLSAALLLAAVFLIQRFDFPASGGRALLTLSILAVVEGISSCTYPGPWTVVAGIRLDCFEPALVLALSGVLATWLIYRSRRPAPP